MCFSTNAAYIALNILNHF